MKPLSELDVIEIYEVAAAGTNHFNVDIPPNEIWDLQTVNSNNETKAGTVTYWQVFHSRGARGATFAYNLSAALSDPLVENFDPPREIPPNTRLRVYFMNADLTDVLQYSLIFKRRKKL